MGNKMSVFQQESTLKRGKNALYYKYFKPLIKKKIAIFSVNYKKNVLMIKSFQISSANTLYELFYKNSHS